MGVQADALFLDKNPFTSESFSELTKEVSKHSELFLSKKWSKRKIMNSALNDCYSHVDKLK